MKSVPNHIGKLLVTSSDLASNFFFSRKLLWHGNECGKNKSNEYFKTPIPSNNYDRPKITGECGMF